MVTSTEGGRTLKRSEQPVRSLTMFELGLHPPQEKEFDDFYDVLNDQEPVQRLTADIPVTDPVLVRVKELLEDGHRGIIFSGPPGTSKSYYAEQIAAHLADFDPDRVSSVQFHASYQYEDFVQGFVPKEDGNGFKLTDKIFLNICDTAREAGEKLVVLIIDELSRCDPSRVFGELLTYIEPTKREKEFRLASGTSVSVPQNLVVLATMNPFDRSVDEVDAAFNRRFVKIEMEPSANTLKAILERNGLPLSIIEQTIQFFNFVNTGKGSNEFSKLGHAYFNSVKNEDGLMRLWDNQLKFFFRKAYALNAQEFERAEALWNKIFKASKASQPTLDSSVPNNVEVEVAGEQAGTETDGN